MKAPRAQPPRRLGLLNPFESRRIWSRRQQFPYAVGDRIAGDLTVIGHLAVGRMGHLYQVWSSRDWCALTCKIVAPELNGDRRSKAALRREARAIARVQHPNLVRSFGGGEHEGLPYLLMEYLEGPSLFDLLERTPGRRIAVADAVRVIIHAGAGLLHMHRGGYLHLDLKPANLLLRDNVPVLVDFDTVRPIGSERRPREPIGTAPYMSPEQARREPATPASDVYGLGALLYELVTGRWAFEDVFAEKEKRTGLERRFPQLGQAPPPPPSRFNPEVPASLERTILTCLAANPEDRFPTMHHLLLALIQELDEPVALWPAGVSTERRREPR
jgi:eukaryotic-like serine/threonine-protein kinase